MKSGKVVNMAGFVYNLLLHLSLPGALIYYVWRVFISKKSRESWRHNLGGLPYLSDRPEGKKLIWLHAVSVGEYVASLPVQEELRRIVPDAMILVTTVTQTGNAMARKSAKEQDTVAYLPLDFPMFVNRGLDRVRPDVIVIMEAEMWPNFLAAAKRRNIPTILVNGRVSDRSLRRSRKWRWLISWAVSKFDYCCMQTNVDAERILALGAKSEAVCVCGNTKFDQEGAQLPHKAVESLRADLGLPEGIPVFVAGSTNPGEDEQVLEAFQIMRRTRADLRLIIAPRQIERGNEIQRMCEDRRLICARRSQKESCSANYDVLILDTFGELAAIYAVGEISFVGGSLIPKGGHSLFQPILQGKPVLFGPYTFKTRDMAQMAINAGVGFEVKDSNELAQRALELLQDVGRLAEIDVICRRLVSENRGASARCAEKVAELLGIRTEVRGGV
ncbi:MAG: 3-deoxy-D-manno-octulosonic acid transferase [Armatimonadetes bacterium]|nr:3-deoxy-D-manno-octulosonic acid transferase [Armatimonadota bacterium]